MLTHTFCHIPRLGAHTERELWRSGCRHWDYFLEHSHEFSTGAVSRDEAKRAIEESTQALSERNHQYFADSLSSKEAWRAWPEFGDKIYYLDIETDGGQSGDSITTVGLYDGKDFVCLVKGQDLGDFPDVISRAGMLVTFFGQGFDIPMLKKAFPMVPFDQIHLDLCFALKRVGVRGGLKKIEKQFGIARGDETDGLSGMDAIRLWRQYQRGDDSSLETLIEYNREDVVNLEVLAAITYGKLRDETLGMAGLSPADFDQPSARLF
ncbi:exonuclease [bacterium]|nr:exonuclease [bacterium]